MYTFVDEIQEGQVWHCHAPATEIMQNEKTKKWFQLEKKKKIALHTLNFLAIPTTLVRRGEWRGLSDKAPLLRLTRRSDNVCFASLIGVLARLVRRELSRGLVFDTEVHNGLVPSCFIDLRVFCVKMW